MAEFIGVAASLVTLIEISTRLADTLRKAVNILQSAESEAGFVAADIQAFSNYLPQLKRVIDFCPNTEVEKLRDIVSALIPACTALVEELEKHIGGPLDLRDKSAHWIEWLKFRFKWIRIAPQVRCIRDWIASFKQTLMLLVSTMDLAVHIHNDASGAIRTILKSQVEANIGFAEDAKETLLEYQHSQRREEQAALLQDAPFVERSNLDSLSIEEPRPTPISQMIVPYNAAKNDEVLLDDSTLCDSSPRRRDMYLWDSSDELQGIFKVQEMTLVLAEGMLAVEPQSAWSWTLGQTKSPKRALAPTSQEKTRASDPEASIIPTSMPMKDHSSHMMKVETGSQSNSTSETVKMTASDARSPQAVPTDGLHHDVDPGRQGNPVLDQSGHNKQTTSKDAVPSHDQVNSASTPDPTQFLSTSPTTRVQRTMGTLGTPRFPTSHSTTASSEFTQDYESLEGSRGQKEDQLGSLSPFERYLLREREERIRRDVMSERRAADLAEKKGDDEAKLRKLEKLILAQKDEQLKREEAADATRKAEKAEAAARLAKEAAEKQAATETASKLLETAKRARDEAEAKAAEEAEMTKLAHERALAEARAAADELERAKRLAEEEAAKLKPDPALKNPPIKFKDFIGRKFSFPWHLCNTWIGMEQLIKQAFLHNDLFGPRVHQGEYDLLLGNGEIILPQVWESMVQPDSVIEMRMWPGPNHRVNVAKLRESFGKVLERRSKSSGN